MKFQKLAFFRDTPAPWQATPPGGPVSLAAMNERQIQNTEINQASTDVTQTVHCIDRSNGVS
ncbi:hypothetical protein P1T57_12145 [Escherichia coli]|nr:hypothetical protein [Escherichia coli]